MTVSTTESSTQGISARSDFETEERNACRLGGAAGLVGSAALLLAGVTYPIFDMPTPEHLDSLRNYPDFATGRIIENSLYLAALLLWAVHLLSLGRALRNRLTGVTPIAPGIALMGLASMAAGALVHISTAAMSDRYVEAVTDAERADIESMWVAVQALFDTLLITGVVTVSVASAALGWTIMRRGLPGRTVGRIALALGLVGTVGGAGAVIMGPDFAGIQVAMLTMMVFHAVVGWRLMRS